MWVNITSFVERLNISNLRYLIFFVHYFICLLFAYFLWLAILYFLVMTIFLNKGITQFLKQLNRPYIFFLYLGNNSISAVQSIGEYLDSLYCLFGIALASELLKCNHHINLRLVWLYPLGKEQVYITYHLITFFFEYYKCILMRVL